MNIEFEFKLLPNKIKMENRQRAYEISFDLPTFRTKKSDDDKELNMGQLHFIYCPKDNLLEFHSFQEYINQYSKLPMPLEAAAWSILDDVFDKVQPCYATVNILTELPDLMTVNIRANRGQIRENLPNSVDLKLIAGGRQ